MNQVFYSYLSNYLGYYTLLLHELFQIKAILTSEYILATLSTSESVISLTKLALCQCYVLDYAQIMCRCVIGGTLDNINALMDFCLSL